MTKNEKNPYLINWEVKKFENFERHQWWMVSVFLIFLALLTYSLLSDNFLLSILIIIAGLLIYLFEKKKPETFRFAICKTGIIAHDHFYEFTEIKSFWIFYEPGIVGRKELSLKLNNRLMPYAQIPLGKENPNKIRNILLKYIPEDKHNESILDYLENII